MTIAMSQESYRMNQTYYKICFKVDRTLQECGPFLTLEQAATMLTEHIPKFAEHIAKNNRYMYEAKVQECTLTREGKWTSLNTLIVENKCQKYKKRTVQADIKTC